MDIRQKYSNNEDIVESLRKFKDSTITASPVSIVCKVIAITDKDAYFKLSLQPLVRTEKFAPEIEGYCTIEPNVGDIGLCVFTDVDFRDALDLKGAGGFVKPKTRSVAFGAFIKI